MRRWRWIFGIALLSAAILGALGALLVSHAEPILRERITETLSARFHSKVQLDGFHVSLAREHCCSAMNGAQSPIYLDITG